MSAELARARKLAYLRIDGETRSLLNDFLPRLGDLIPGILNAFYEHIMTEEGLAAMFADEAAVEHAKKAQMAHWERMFSGRFDDDYFDSVQRIGRTHNRLGLEPGWYLGGYALVKQMLIEAVLADANKTSAVGKGRRITVASTLLVAIDKVISLDMDLSIQTYLEEQDKSFNERLGDLADQFGSVIASIATDLSESASAMQAQTCGLGDNITSAAEEVSQADSGAESATANLQTVASAAEELSTSIAEISRQLHEGTRVTGEAVDKADQMTNSVSSLQTAADSVGGIIQLIEEIADQTNLLALNATIEAARAGEAGRGFAVVAGEVKGLAQQTANATGEIAAQIKEIQSVAGTVGGHIEQISASIGNVQNVSAAISSAMEEHQEISRSVSNAAGGSASVTSSVQKVSEMAGKCRDLSSSLAEASNRVRDKAEDLSERSKFFITEIRNANKGGRSDDAEAA